MKILKRSILYICLFAIAIGLSVGCNPTPPSSTSANQQTLNIYNWATYIAPEVLTQFEQKYNTKIKYDNFDSEDALYAKLKPGNPGYDLIFPTDYMLRRMIKEEMVLPLDQNKIPNQKHLDPKFVNTSYDPGNKYSMPYQWGTMGIGYNIKITGKEIDSWGALFEPKYKNKVALMDEVRGTMAMALIYLGHNPSTINQTEINQAKDFLIKHKNNIKAFVADTGQDVLNQGEVALTNEWSGDIFQVMKQNPDLRYTIPKEGSTIPHSALQVLRQKSPFKTVLKLHSRRLYHY
jgi:spermidine/putrescine transport system substrate-binding protein